MGGYRLFYDFTSSFSTTPKKSFDVDLFGMCLGGLGEVWGVFSDDVGGGLGDMLGRCWKGSGRGLGSFWEGF